MFLCHIPISRSEEVLSLGPDTLITKPGVRGGIPIMLVCPDASGTNRLILKQKSSVSTQRRNQAWSPFKQRYVRSIKGGGPVAVNHCWLCKGVMNLLASWCCDWPGMTSLVLRSVSLSLSVQRPYQIF